MSRRDDFVFGSPRTGLLLTEASVQEALVVVANSPRPREAKFALLAIGHMLEPNKVKALAHLANLVYGYVDACKNLVSEVLDSGIDCSVAVAEFEIDPWLTTPEVFTKFKEALRCEITDAPHCRQDQFRADHAGTIDLVMKDSEVSQTGAKKTQEFLEKLAKGSLAHARGLRYRCSKIGDLIIFLQCPADAIIVTLDRAFLDFARIGRRRYILVPSLTQLKAQQSGLSTA